MQKNFIQQFCLGLSGTMVPERYQRWTALSLLGMTAGRKVYVDREHYELRPILYITLVGKQGVRKSTPKDKAKDMFTECFPDYTQGASVMSREKIIEIMSSDDACRTYTDENGQDIEWKPMAFFVNELKNFLSVNPIHMVDFLTDIYDVKFFKSENLARGAQPIINPCLSILACATPDYIMDCMKLNVISGGFSRRMLYVYETQKQPRRRARKSKEAHEADAWCKAHLKRIYQVVGKFTVNPDADDYLDNWFINLPDQTNPVLEGYYEAKDSLVLKIAMLLALSYEQPRLTITLEDIAIAIAFLDSIEDNLPKLTMAAGKNEFAIVHQRLLQVLEEQPNKMMKEVEWRRIASMDLKDNEYQMVKKMLVETEQIKSVPMGTTVVIVLFSAIEDLKARKILG